MRKLPSISQWLPRIFGLGGVCVSALLLLGGCDSLPKRDGALHGPYFKPTVFQSAEKMPLEIRRVAILPIADGAVLPEEALGTLDASVVKSLNLAARFECVHLTRDDIGRMARTRSLRSIDVLPHDFFDRIASDYAVDAVMFVDLVHYSAYPPIAMGVRAKLFRITDRNLIWAIDQTFNAADPLVSNSARRYWLNSAPAGTPSDMSNTVLQVPSRFAAYVFSACFDTLPRR